MTQDMSRGKSAGRNILKRLLTSGIGPVLGGSKGGGSTVRQLGEEEQDEEVFL